MASEKIVDILIKFGLDRERAGQAAKSIKEIDKAADDAGKAAEQSRAKFARMREDAEKLAGIGVRIGAVGASLLGPLTLAANNYVKSVGMATETSRAWSDAQQDIEDSTLRVGKVAAGELLPFMEKSAQLASTIAGMLESNPDIVKAAVIGGAILTGGGAAISTVGTIMGLVGKAGALLGLGGGAAAAGGAGAAGAAGAGGAAAAGGLGIAGALGGLGLAAALPILLGTIVDKAINKPGTLRPMDTIAGVPVTELMERSGTAAQALDNLTTSAGKTASAVMDIQAEKGVGAYIAFQKQQTDTEAAAQKQRDRINSDTGKALVKAEAAYGRERTRAVADFNRERLKALAALDAENTKADQASQKERLDRAKKYGVEVERAEQDHQRAMARLSQDHAKTMRDAVADNDARAAFEEMQNYEVERNRAEEDYHTEAERRSQDFAAELDDVEAQRKEERAQRMADFEQQQKDALEQFALQQADRKAQYDEQVAAINEDGKNKLAELNTALGDQKTAQGAAFKEQLNALGIYLGDEKNLRDKYYADMLTSFQTFMKAGAQTQTEAAPTQTLTQMDTGDRWGRVQGALASGASGGSIASIDFQPQFYGMGEKDQEWYKQVARDQAQNIVNQMLRTVQRRQE